MRHTQQSTGSLFSLLSLHPSFSSTVSFVKVNCLSRERDPLLPMDIFVRDLFMLPFRLGSLSPSRISPFKITFSSQNIYSVSQNCMSFLFTHRPHSCQPWKWKRTSDSYLWFSNSSVVFHYQVSSFSNSFLSVPLSLLPRKECLFSTRRLLSHCSGCRRRRRNDSLKSSQVIISLLASHVRVL